MEAEMNSEMAYYGPSVFPMQFLDTPLQEITKM